ncbi:T9SS type A sorting domain-containing protein [Pontibacter cellulosilyticus]|uniref:T9SS type A sorting domain-containing protein n=1 Tax=Pontibacter cellulosilyticus TaxID=1720253 RepID=A0A923SJU1_9BACT|nr:T9SS type A sorting domain-containing protein [Pontibacter cellulosilyticus]MBC5994254.1 T9SS type A sorting domain-containing protein [Pontibacter cellulosilyticus]
MAVLPAYIVQAQTTTSWIGSNNNTNWNTSTNWTNGVPSATKHAIIGDANYPSNSKPPEIDQTSLAECLSLTVGGARPIKLLVSTDKGLTVRGDVIILSNGEIENEGSDINVEGNWTNDNIYLETVYTKGKSTRAQSVKNPTISFSGAGKTIGGTAVNNFSNLTISGNIQLSSGINLVTLTPSNNSTDVLPTLTVSGTLDPGVHLVNIPNVAGTKFVFNEGATIFIKSTSLVSGSSYYANFSIRPTTMFTSSVFNYAGGNQVIESDITYGILRVSGSGTKTLDGNTVVYAAQGTQLAIDAGTLDLETYTLDRGSSPGGVLSMASGTTLRIGGINTLPANYVTYTLDANSTVEYYGTNQLVTSVTYGHLLLSNTGTKTMPATAMTVAGNLTSTGSVSFTAGAPIAVTGNVTIGTGTTFNGGSATHTVAGNWAANGTFVGNASTVTMTGAGKTISSTAGATEFNNLTLSGTGTSITVPALTIRGNLAATGGLSQVADGTITMQNSSSKSISGSGINFQNLTIDGAVTTGSNFTVNGNFTTNTGRSFTASAGTVSMAGAGKSIAGAGSMNYWGLNIAAATSTPSSFTVTSSLSGVSALTASGGTVTFSGTSTFGGTHYLNNAAITGTSMRMLANANLYIAGAMTRAGSSLFDVSSSIPNSVHYNGTNPQSILATTYHHLILSNAGTQTTGGAVTVNGNITLATGSTLNAGAFSHSILGNWINNGTFNHDNGTITFTGGANASISGTTTFGTLAVNKTSAANTLTLNNNVTATNLSMASGDILTGINKVILLGDRTGNGWVIGTLSRSHAFADGVSYAFNGPHAKATFTSPGSISQVDVTYTEQAISGFTVGTPVTGKYTVAIPAGSYSSGNLQLQYRDANLNGNSESSLKLYQYDAGLSRWRTYGRTSFNSTDNWVSRSSLTNLAGEWAMSSSASIYSWVGGTSTAWETAANWIDVTDGMGVSATVTPYSQDVAILGEVAPINHPVINSAVTVSGVQFKGTATTNLSIGSGSLNVTGNLSAVGAGASHTLSTNSNSLTVGGNLTLNDGSAGNNISLVNGSGSITVSGSITQPAGASVSLGSGNLNIGGNYNYTLGASFTAGTSTVTYNGTGAQAVAALPYHHLSINKPTATTATYTSGTAQAITGNLSVSGLGNLSLDVPSMDIAGGVNIAGGTLTGNGSSISLQGNWSTASASSFVPGTSTVIFYGGAAQTVSATTFNNLIINKIAALTTAGNLVLNGNLDVQSGILVMDSHTVNRSTTGGLLQVANGATILTRGTVGFPANFNTNTLGINSNVIYDAGTSSIAPITYGNLTVQGSGTKGLQGNTQVANGMLVSAGAGISGSAVANLTLAGNLQNNGTLNTVTTNLIFTGAGAQLSGSGSTSINNLTVNAGADLAISQNTKLEGSLVNNGTALNAASVELDFIGTAAASINSASTPISIGNLKVTKTNATVTLASDIISLQNLVVSSGTFDIGTRTITEHASVISGLSVAAGATLKAGGTNTLPALDNYIFNSSSTMAYSGSAQQVKVLQYGNLTLENAGVKTFGVGTTSIAGAYSITGGASADMLTNSSTINFNGTGAQSIPGLAYHSITINGGNSKTLLANATVTTDLRLTNGKVSTGSNRFILGGTATIVENENNYVIGFVETQRNVSTALENFGGIGIAVTPAVSPGAVTVVRETGRAISASNGNQSILRNFSFTVAGTNAGLNATVTMNYFTDELGWYDENTLLLYHSKDGTNWTQHTSSVPDPTNNRLGANGLQSLTRLTLGSSMSPLPIELSYFAAQKQGQNAVLTWITKSEKENRGFEVEVSADGKSYRKIGSVEKGTGTSAVETRYTFTDTEPGKSGVRYYRLKQLDRDGTHAYYGPRAVEFGNASQLAATAYPNPFQSQVNLSIPAEAVGMAKIRLYNTAGKMLLEQKAIMEAGTNSFTIDTAGKAIPAGVYVITVEAGGQLQRLKLLKE